MNATKRKEWVSQDVNKIGKWKKGVLIIIVSLIYYFVIFTVQRKYDESKIVLLTTL